MKITHSGALRDLLTTTYGELKRRLAPRVGSLDAASEVLHETYLRLARYDVAAPVANPQAYLMRMALNVAADRSKSEKEFVSASTVDELWHLADDVLDPETIVAARGEIDLFKEALRELPERTRVVLIAARVDEQPHEIIAERLGISARMVQHELRRALEHCAERLGRRIVRRFGPPRKQGPFQ